MLILQVHEAKATCPWEACWRHVSGCSPLSSWDLHNICLCVWEDVLPASVQMLMLAAEAYGSALVIMSHAIGGVDRVASLSLSAIP